MRRCQGRGAQSIGEHCQSWPKLIKAWLQNGIPILHPKIRVLKDIKYVLKGIEKNY